MEEKKKSRNRTKERSKKAVMFGKKSKGKTKKSNEQPVENELLPGSPFVGKYGIFGVPLSLAVKRMGSHDGVPLPVVVRKCIDCINEKGMCIEGIHRISAPKMNLDKLEEEVNSRQSIQLDNVHDASGLLKRFLRQLPEHILTNKERTVFEKIAGNCPCGVLSPCRCLVADMLKARLNKLPAENYMLLAYVFIHAQMILQHSEQNKMGMAALGLILQATLNISQSLVRIFLLNASDVIPMEYHSSSMVYLFNDVEVKRYVEPKSPKIICEENFSGSEEELCNEERKQQSRLQQLHLQIEELRELNLPLKQAEEELWDVQTAITMLCRKLKSIRMQKAEEAETRESSGPTPTLEMFEEKQLLAACTALREDIVRHKSEIIALDRCLSAMKEVKTPEASKKNNNKENNNDNDSYWREECRKEEKKRNDLLSQIISLRNHCCQLRAQIELNALKKPTLLVTRF